ncbi:MAG: ferrous iron transporter B [Kiritimatiellae bacterium]|nr:ferrous iron transporter B [Kiritimatiellia bacterium]
MATKIALAGNPNCGKTTLFNELTGSNQYVGNWPGVTVEKKEGYFDGHKDLVIQDLPGIYSLSPYSLEERVSRNFLVTEKPDCILNIVDGMNIERNLYLTTQLAELGVPMVVAVNMMDLVERQGDKIDFDKLGRRLGCQVVGISAQKRRGCRECAAEAIRYAKAGRAGEVPHVFTGSVEHALAHIEESIQGKVPENSIRWYAIKIFERDHEAIKGLNLPAEVLEHVETHIVDCERELEDDAESIITSQRYEFIQKLVKECVKKNEKARSKVRLSDRIDRVVTNRILAIPIFVLSLLAMYWLAVSEGGPGTVLTDWANDGFLGDGWHLPYSQHESTNERSIYRGMDWEAASEAFAKPQASIERFEAAFDDPDKIDAESAKDVKVQAWLEDEETGEIVEDEDGNPDIWEVDYQTYLSAKAMEEPEPNDFGIWVPGVGALCGELCEKCGIAEGTLAYALVNDGVVGGVCTVLGFIPVITIVFLFLAFLEDCGYMARVAFIMDRLFRGFGLSGKSFIPMLVGKGCGVPAVMAARTIENKRDQRMTIILATFIPCGAKTVIIAMFSAVFFREYWYLAAAMDLVGIAIIVLGGIALKKTRFFAGEAAPFVMELPAYHLPTFKGIVIHTWTRVKGYAVKAGAIIFPACVVLTLMMTFDWSFHVVEDLGDSILASLGGAIAWFFAPLGFGTWQGAAASVSAEIAKEQATATLAMVAGGEGSAAANILQMFKDFAGADYKAAALSFMMFNLFIPPCLVAIAVTFREMGSKLWGCLALAFQLFVGYALALNAYQWGRLAISGEWGFWTVLAALVDVFVLWAIFRPQPKGTK